MATRRFLCGSQGLSVKDGMPADVRLRYIAQPDDFVYDRKDGKIYRRQPCCGAGAVQGGRMHAFQRCNLEWTQS
jgi:hypothetical protein